MPTKTATVASAKVAATLSNFPVYINLSRVKGSAMTQAEADSVRIYTDSAKTTEIAREIVSVSECHAKIPSLTTTTQLWVDYDGSRSDYAATDTYGRNAVWSDYSWVSHMEDLTTSTILDSTSGGRTGTKTSANNPEVSSGQIGNSQEISSDRIDTSSIPMTATNNFTIQAWLRPTATGNFYAIVHNGADSNGAAIAMNSSSWAMLIAGKTWGTSNLSVTTNSWALIHCIRDAGTNKVFRNTTQASSVEESSSAPNTPATRLRLGIAAFNTNYAGKIDEVRLRASVLSANWITTEYNNQSDESSFWPTWSDAGAPVANNGFALWLA